MDCRPVLERARHLGPYTHDLSRELGYKNSAQIGVYPNRRPHSKTSGQVPSNILLQCQILTRT
jgi:hypothetical protein